jgi:hypothetical protein
MGKTKSGSQCRSCWFTLLGVFPFEEDLEGSKNMMKQWVLPNPRKKKKNKNPTILKNMTNSGFWSKFSQLVFLVQNG